MNKLQHPLTALIERIQFLESRVESEPFAAITFNITFFYFIRSFGASKKEQEDGRCQDGPVSDPPSAIQDQPLHKRVENLEAWVKSYTGGIPNNALGFAMRELEGRLLKRISGIEGQLTQVSTQELPNKQRELESKMDRLLRSEELPSFGKATTSVLPTNLEMRLNRMELNQGSLMAENEKLQARIGVLEETRNPTTLKQVMDRLDNVIRMANNHETDTCELNQAMYDIQQDIIARSTDSGFME